RNASQSGAPSSPPARRTWNTSTTRGQRSGFLADCGAGSRPGRPRRRGTGGAGAGRGAEGKAWPAAIGRPWTATGGQGVGGGWEAVDGVEADNLDPPGARAFGPDLDRHGVLVGQGEAPAEVPGDVLAVERREVGRPERGQVVPHPGLGVSAGQVALDPGQVGHRRGRGGQGMATGGAARRAY